MQPWYNLTTNQEGGGGLYYAYMNKLFCWVIQSVLKCHLMNLCTVWPDHCIHHDWVILYISCRLFWQNIRSPISLTQFSFSSLHLSAFCWTKITFEREILSCGWDYRNDEEVIDGGPKRGMFKLLWKLE